MNAATARQTFRERVAEVAAKAKAILPEAINGRLEAAAKLVLLHDVTPQDDGSIVVGSSSDPLKTYRLVGTTCECQDFTRGQAPDGWCQHRIAAGIAKRVGELLPPAPPVEPEPAPAVPLEPAPQAGPTPALPEAPASVNVRLLIEGRDCQLTLRDSDEGRLLQRLDALLARYPVPQPSTPPAQRSPQQYTALAMHRPITPPSGYCLVHDVEMRWNDGKDGRKGWFSHRQDDGAWCKGRK